MNTKANNKSKTNTKSNAKSNNKMDKVNELTNNTKVIQRFGHLLNCDFKRPDCPIFFDDKEDFQIKRMWQIPISPDRKKEIVYIKLYVLYVDYYDATDATYHTKYIAISSENDMYYGFHGDFDILHEAVFMNLNTVYDMFEYTKDKMLRLFRNYYDVMKYFEKA